MIGLAASCILVGLRHLGPLSSTPQSGAVAGTAADGGVDPAAPFDAARSAAAAAGTFMKVLGRALDTRFSKHLGRAALTTVMSAVLHCWPPPPPPPSAGGNESSSGSTAVPPAAEVAGSSEAAGAGQRGYAMGWWNLDPDGRLRSSNSSGGAGEPAPNHGANSGAGTGEATQPGQDVLEDEWGSFPCLDDAALNAILGGSAASQPSAQQQAAAAAAAETAAAEAAVEEERQKTWLSLADGARTHALPHLHEILKTTYTIARYAQGSSASSSSSVPSFSSFTHRRNPAAPSAASSSSSSTARGVPPRAAATTAVSTAVGASSSSSSLAATGRSSSSSAAFLSSIESSRVDAGTLLELHAAAALVVLHGSGSRHIDEPCSTYNTVRDKYLEVHRMAHSPLVPQQRLLAPAFFCLALGSASGKDANDGDNGGSRQHRSGIETSPGGSPCPRPPRPAPPLLEALRGREWEVLQLWVQAALDPLVFPVSQRRHRLSRGGRDGGRRASREPSDIVRDRFEGFTRCLSAAFGDGGGARGNERSGMDGARERSPPLDADVAGVFEKRLVRFEPARLAALSSEEARVRDTGARCCVVATLVSRTFAVAGRLALRIVSLLCVSCFCRACSGPSHLSWRTTGGTLVSLFCWPPALPARMYLCGPPAGVNPACSPTLTPQNAS